MDEQNDIRRLGNQAFLQKLFPGQAGVLGAWPPLLQAWNALVGENLGCHSQAREVNRGILLVDIDHPAWMQQFLFQKDDILEKIQKKVPQLEIKALRLRLVADLAKPPLEPDLPEVPENLEEKKPPPKDLQESLRRLKAVLKD